MQSQRRSGVVLGYANILVKNIVNLLYTPMLLSFVGQGDYGVFQTTNSFIFSLSLLSFGFSGAYVRFYTQRKAKGDEEGIRVLNGMYLLLYLAICSIVAIIGLIFSANVELFFSSRFSSREVNLAAILMVIMSLNVATTLFSTVFDANIIAHEQFKFQQTRQLFTTLTIPALALVLLMAGMGAVGVAAAQLSVNVVLLMLNARFAIRRLGMRFDVKRFDASLLKAVAAFSGWIFANQICDLINQNVPNVILGAACGAKIVAVFAIAIQIRGIFISLSTVISNVFVPLVNSVVAESNDDAVLTRVMSRVGRYQAMLLCWVYGGFVLLGRFFINHWAGENFSDAYPLLLSMVFPLLVPLCQNVGIEIQKAKNMHKARSLVYLVMAAMSVAFALVASPSLGFWAPAIAYTVSITLGNCLFMNWYYQRRVGLDMIFYWRQVMPVACCAFAATFVSAIGIVLFPVMDWLQFLFWGALYTCAYGTLSWFIVLSGSEKSAIKAHGSRLASRGKR